MFLDGNAETPRQSSLPTNQSSGSLLCQTEFKTASCANGSKSLKPALSKGVQATRPFLREVVMGLCRSLLVLAI